MLNVPELEKRWKRYRRRKKTPFYLFVTAVLLMTGAGLYYAYRVHEESTPEQTAAARSETSSAAASSSEPPVTIAVAGERPAPAAPSPASQKGQTPAVSVQTTVHTDSAPPPKTAPTKLQPSMEFMEDFEADVMDYYFQDNAASPAEKPAPPAKTAGTDDKQTKAPTRTEAETSLPSLHRTKIETDRQDRTVASAEPEKNRLEKKPAKKPVLTIQRESDMKDIQDVIARFKKNKNPALSLFVAKRYYAIGNYQKAYNYALITNELDSDIEDSWLIFAKSLYKLDQKEMAIKTLRTYQSESGSVKARITLEQMESGTFE